MGCCNRFYEVRKYSILLEFFWFFGIGGREGGSWGNLDGVGVIELVMG